MAKEIETLAAFAGYMMRWIDLQATKMKSVGIDREVNVMSGTEFVAALSVDGYGPDRLIELKTMVDYIFNEQIESEWAVDKGKAEDQEPQLSAVTQSVLEGFLMIMDLMLGGNQVHRDDYRAVVVRTVERKQKRTAPVFGLVHLVDWELFIGVFFNRVICNSDGLFILQESQHIVAVDLRSEFVVSQSSRRSEGSSGEYAFDCRHFRHSLTFGLLPVGIGYRFQDHTRSQSRHSS